MQILQVDLDNVKSYTSASIPFTPGINAICGENGAGKSTLLEAIGFALFGHAPFMPQSQIVREGEKTATITVHVLGDDERAYHVVRKVGGTNQHFVYDPELDQKLADGVEESLAWLRDFAGVDEATDLDALFSDAVGVAQGKLTTVFTETPSRRKDVFDPLLRVDEYQNAGDRLREPRSWLGHRCQEYEKDMARLEARTEPLPDREAESMKLAEAIEEAENRTTKLKSGLAEVASRKEMLDTFKVRLDALKQEVTKAESEKQYAAARLWEAQEALTRAEAAQAVVDKTTAGHDAYMAAEAALEELDTQRDTRDKLRDEKQRDEKQLAKIEEQLAGLARQLEAVAEAEAMMAELRPQVEEQVRLEQALADARRDADRLKLERGALADAQTRLSELRDTLVEVQSGVAQRRQVEAELNELRTALIPLNAECAAASETVTSKKTELGSLSDQQAQAAGRVDQAERDLAQERRRLADWEQRRAKLQDEVSERARLETECEAGRQELETLHARADELTETAARHTAELDHVGTQLQALTSTKAGQCPVCERELTPEHRDELLARQQARQKELDEALAGVRAEQKAVQKAVRAQDKALRRQEEELKRLARADEVEAATAQIATLLEICEQRENRLREVQTEAAGLEARIEALRAQLTEIEARQRELDTAQQAKQGEADALERRLRDLPRSVDVETLMAQISDQDGRIEERGAAVEALSDAPDKVERLGQELATLGDPRSEYRRQEGTAGRRAAVAQEQADAERRKAEVTTALAAHAETLEAYDGLDDRIVEARGTRSAHEEDHRRYLEYSREAATLPERREAVDTRFHEAEAAVERHREIAAARDAVAAEFDANEYALVEAKHGTLTRELAELKGQLGQQRQRQAVLGAEIVELRQTKSRLDKVCAEHAEHRDLLALLEYLRQVLHDAGPEITKALVGVISRQAEDLYMDIMRDYTARLRWTDDYDIELVAGGKTRSFQQLSGGEQTAAALAVRLALLREISSINLAFFDEPTANLDRERRTNLAAQILNVRGFAQLFVISHDDTFEQDTDHVIHVAKRNGASEVEA
mgnify:CR=1 FL=1